MTATRRSLVPLLLLATVVATPTTTFSADAPATQPTTRSTANLDAITGAYLQLANGNSLQRYEAKLQLMGLTRADLPTLLAVVKANLPVTPTQAIALRDVVIQAHVAGEELEPDL